MHWQWTSRSEKVLIITTVLCTLLIPVILPHDTVPLRYKSGPAFVPLHPGRFWHAAFENLTDWKNSLFARTAALYKETEFAHCQDAKHCQQLLETDGYGHAEPRGLSRYNLTRAFIQCPMGDLSRIGHSQDGGKMVCQSDLNLPGCVVFSLGSNGDYSFEQGVLQTTGCTVVTFDCTFSGTSQHTRHLYFKKCIGSEEKALADHEFLTLQGAMSLAGYKDITLLKIDIEGFEYDVFATWKPSSILPRQIAIEVHSFLYGLPWAPGAPREKPIADFNNMYWSRHKFSLADFALFMGHMAHLGYGIVYDEDNLMGDEWQRCCAELLLYRVGWVQR